MTIVFLSIILLLTLLLLWIGKDWDERGKELERERRMNGYLNEIIEQKENRIADLETENWKLKREKV